MNKKKKNAIEKGILGKYTKPLPSLFVPWPTGKGKPNAIGETDIYNVWNTGGINRKLLTPKTNTKKSIYKKYRILLLIMMIILIILIFLL